MKEHELARKQEEEKAKEAEVVKPPNNMQQGYVIYPQSFNNNQ